MPAKKKEEKKLESRESNQTTDIPAWWSKKRTELNLEEMCRIKTKHEEENPQTREENMVLGMMRILRPAGLFRCVSFQCAEEGSRTRKSSVVLLAGGY